MDCHPRPAPSRCSHPRPLIGGQRTPGTSGRFRRCLHTCNRCAWSACAVRDRCQKSRARSTRRRPPSPGWAATTPLARTRHVPLQGTARAARRARSSRRFRGSTALSDAAGELARGIDIVEYACGALVLSQSEFTENVSASIDAHALRQPLGVVAGITPFNFPAMVPAVDVPDGASSAAIPFVLTLRERDPSASLVLAQLLKEAGLPDRRLQRDQRRQVRPSTRLLAHPDVQAVSFGRLDADREVHLRHRHRRTANACRRWAARRTMR